MIARNLLKILMKGMNINLIDKSRELDLMGSKRINFNYYPKCPNPELTVGVGRHSDVSTLTILLQDNVGGLYVRDNFDGDSWIHVPPINGALVVNIGDALQILSNDRYKSAEHRVIPSGYKNRVSIPVFVNPMPNSVIAPFSELINSGNKSIYKQVVYAEYVKNFYRNAHNGKATIDFAKI